MTTHTQWIEVHSDGAAPRIGWRCDGCGQVKWQEEQPDAPCDLCDYEKPPTIEEITAVRKTAQHRSRNPGAPNPERTQ